MLAIAKHPLSPWTRLKPAFLPMGWEREGLTAAGRESRHARRCRELAAKQREIAGADRGACRIQSRLSASKTKDKRRGAKKTFLVNEKMPRCTSNWMPALCLKLGPLGRAFVVRNALYLGCWEKQQAR